MPRKTPKGSNKQLIKYKAGKTIKKFWRSVLSALLAGLTAYLAKKGLDLDLSDYIKSPELVEALTAGTLALIYGAIEAWRNYSKHKLGRELY